MSASRNGVVADFPWAKAIFFVRKYSNAKNYISQKIYKCHFNFGLYLSYCFLTFYNYTEYQILQSLL